jgi:hypothetical protein
MCAKNGRDDFATLTSEFAAPTGINRNLIDDFHKFLKLLTIHTQDIHNLSP